jgi:hypothetical protein
MYRVPSSAYAPRTGKHSSNTLHSCFVKIRITIVTKYREMSNGHPALLPQVVSDMCNEHGRKLPFWPRRSGGTRQSEMASGLVLYHTIVVNDTTTTTYLWSLCKWFYRYFQSFSSGSGSGSGCGSRGNSIWNVSLPFFLCGVRTHVPHFLSNTTTLWSVRTRHKTRCIHPNDTRGGCQACCVPLCLLFGLVEFCFCTTSFVTLCSCSVSYKPGKLHAPMPLRGSTDVCVNFFTVSISFHLTNPISLFIDNIVTKYNSFNNSIYK